MLLTGCLTGRQNSVLTDEKCVLWYFVSEGILWWATTCIGRHCTKWWIYKRKKRFQCYVLSDMEVYKNNDLNNINTYLYSGTTNSKVEGEVSRKQRPAWFYLCLLGEVAQQWELIYKSGMSIKSILRSLCNTYAPMNFQLRLYKLSIHFGVI